MSIDSKAQRCSTCGTIISWCPSKLCHNCWEIEQRLDTYLKSRAARVYVLRRMGVEDLAHAIIDLNNLGFADGGGPKSLAGCRLWDDLADSALLVGGRSRRPA